MDFRQLRYFSVVAELKSFSLAAQNLRIAQPALSRCVKEVEASLGVRLLNRHGRGVSLTSAGESLYAHATRLLRDLRQATDEVVATAGKPVGQLYLAIPTATGAILVPPVIERYRALYPNVAVHILEGFSGYIHEWLMNGRVDVGVLHNPSKSSKLETTHLMTEEMCVICPGPAAASKLHIKPKSSYHARELADLPLILPGRPHSSRLLVEGALAKFDKPLKLAYEVDGLPIIKSMVERGLGFTVLTRGAVGSEIKDGRLTAATIRSPRLIWELKVASRADRKPSEATLELIRIIREEVDRSLQAQLWGGVPTPRVPKRLIARRSA